MNTTPRYAVALLGLMLAAGNASAQEKVLREGQVTEKALIEALSPDAAASGAGESMRTRSFRPSVRPAGAVAS